MNDQGLPILPALSERLAGTHAPYAQFVGESLQTSSDELALRWLERLVALLPVDPQSVFSTQLLLDHIPALIHEVGKYVAAPTEEDIAAKASVVDKARELGQLRHRQQASLHQVLREYDLLGDLLETFVINQTRTFAGAVTAVATLEVARRLNRAVRVLMQITAGTFISDYTDTITEQATRLDRFNRSISHELRNVLGTLRFGAELIDDPRVGPDETRRKQIVATVRRSSERALNIIQSFERLPRSGIASDTPREQMVDLSETIQEVFRQLRDMADARGVELRTHSHFPTLYLDSGALELILINLVSNAIKYSDQSRTPRYVQIGCEEHDSAYEIKVQDNGIGIPAASVGKVFERFTRAHAALDKELGVDGTGLGLSIVEECVEALNGKVSVQSREGEGTTFTVTIPKKLPPIVATTLPV